MQPKRKISTSKKNEYETFCIKRMVVALLKIKQVVSCEAVYGCKEKYKGPAVKLTTGPLKITD